MNYSLFSNQFTAISTSTTVRFTSTDPGGSTGGIVLDDIAVNSVPEPSSLGVLSCSVVARYARLVCRCRNFDGRLGELPDRQHHTENKDAVNCSLENGAAFFFRAYYQTVSGFEFVIDVIGCVHVTT